MTTPTQADMDALHEILLAEHLYGHAPALEIAKRHRLLGQREGLEMAAASFADLTTKSEGDARGGGKFKLFQKADSFPDMIEGEADGLR